MMTVALLLLSTIEVETAASRAALYLLLLGLGLGMVMQNLVMAVQNAVSYERLGVATSGTTLFRSIGGSVGAALFGGIFAYFLDADIHGVVPGVEGLLNPAEIARLAEPVRSLYLSEFVKALYPVFHTAAAMTFVGFFLTLAIREVPLRTTIAPEPLTDAFPHPRDATSLDELKRIVTRMTAQENRWRVYQRAAGRIGLALEPDELWLLARMGEGRGRATQADLEGRLRIATRQCAELLGRLVASGMATRSEDGLYELSEAGRAGYERLIERREADLEEMLADWDRNQHPDVRAMMKELARSFAATPPARV
jgi:DNA-binding MarR family transcriptional regulator